MVCRSLIATGIPEKATEIQSKATKRRKDVKRAKIAICKVLEINLAN